MNEELKQAVAAIKAGDKSSAFRLLRETIESSENEEDVVMAWVMMSAVVSDPARQRQALEAALELDPEHELARARLAKLEAALGPPVAEEEAEEEEVEPLLVAKDEAPQSAAPMIFEEEEPAEALDEAILEGSPEEEMAEHAAQEAALDEMQQKAQAEAAEPWAWEDEAYEEDLGAAGPAGVYDADEVVAEEETELLVVEPDEAAPATGRGRRLLWLLLVFLLLLILAIALVWVLVAQGILVL